MNAKQTTAVLSQSVPVKSGELETVSEARRRLFVRCFCWFLLRKSLLFGTGYLFLLGTLILVARLWELDGFYSGLLMFGWGPAVLLGLVLIWQVNRQVRRLASRFGELLDSHAQLGGRLMFQDEVQSSVNQLVTGSMAIRVRPDGDVSVAALNDLFTREEMRVKVTDVPEVRYRYGRHLMLFGLAGVFLVGSILAPVRSLMDPVNEMELSGPVEELQSRIDVLLTEKVIDPELAEQLTDQLERISTQANRENPGATWQALDQLEERVQDLASVASQKMVKGGQEFAEAEEQIGQDKGAFGNQDLQDLESLNDLLQKNVRDNQLLKDGMIQDKELLDLLDELEKKMNELSKSRLAKAKLVLNKDLSQEKRARIEKELKELGIEEKDQKKSVSEMDSADMKKLAEMSKDLKSESLEQQLKELAKKFSQLDGKQENTFELTRKQLEELKKKFGQMDLADSDLQMLVDPESAPVSSPPPQMITQVFVNQEIDQEQLKKARELVKKLKVPEKQFGEVEPFLLEGIKDAMFDGDLRKSELDYLRPEIEKYLHDSGLEPVENDILEKLRQGFSDAGIAEEDFLIILASECQCQGGGGGAPDEDLIRLAQKLKSIRGQLREKIKRLKEAGALSESLAKQCQSSLGGGGISRGGGATPMRFNEKGTDTSDARFKPLVLPLDRVNDEQSRLLAVKKGDASKLKAGEIDRTRVLKDTESTGQANHERILPQHRRFLEKYRNSGR